MAEKETSTRSDVIQILMFTFFLCALFFGAWGAFLHWQVKKLETKSTGYFNATKRMHDDLKKEENRALQRQSQQLQDLKDRDKSLSYVVGQVLESMAEQVRPVISDTRTNEKNQQNFSELEFTFRIESGKLDNIIAFFAKLEATRPDIRVSKATLGKKRKAGVDEAVVGDTEGWSAETVKLVCYVPKESGGAAQPAAESESDEAAPEVSAPEAAAPEEPAAEESVPAGAGDAPHVEESSAPEAPSADASTPPEAGADAKPKSEP